MKVVHFECGLGNQITCFANYLLVKKNNPNDDIYIEDFVYRIERNGIGINQWNGFELEHVFDLSFSKIINTFKEPEKILLSMEREYSKNEGQFNSYSALTVLNNFGLNLRTSGELLKGKDDKSFFGRLKAKLKHFLTSPSKNVLAYNTKKLLYSLLKKIRKHGNSDYLFSEEAIFYPLSFNIMKNIKLLDYIRNDLLEQLVFPPINDEKNSHIKSIIESNNSISIHVRRSDFLQYNSDCYKYGFFKKAVKYIKKRVKEPVFIVFSEDSEWCKNNLTQIGLDSSKDIFYFVDWNTGSNSYRDLQLMSMCKHNIITKSSFGWWAAYLNKNDDKIVCSQMSEYYSWKSF